MKSDINISNWFTTPVSYKFLTEIDNNKIKEYSYTLKEYCDGNKISNHGGWQSKNLNINENEEIKKLTIEITKESFNFLKIFSMKKEYNLYFENIWININKKGDFNTPHIHPNSFISGVYYVNCNEQSGRIIFENPCQPFDCFMNSEQIETINSYNAGKAFHIPQKNKLVLFPSYLNHYVEPNRNTEDRISLSFNLSLKK
jgi:uncharacterized protein (TIGR02466 family)